MDSSTHNRSSVVDVKWSLEKILDSGSMQHNLLQETLKEGGGIPKQEIPLSS